MSYDSARRRFFIIVAASLIIAASAGSVVALKAYELSNKPNLIISPPILYLGKIGEGTVCKGSVQVRNIAGKTINIDSIRSSCGCTTVNEIKKIRAGQTIPLPIQFNSSKKVGRNEQYIWIFTHDSPGKPSVITVRAEVVQDFTIRPSSLEIGTISPDETKYSSVLISQNDKKDLHLSGVRVPRGITTIVRQVSRDTVAVDLSVSGSLAPGIHHENITALTSDHLQKELAVPLTFIVPNVFTPNPEHINFGVVQHGQKALSHVSIQADDVRKLAILSKSPQTDAKIQCISLQKASLEVTLHNERRNNNTLFSEKIVLSTGNKKQPILTIPVYAAFSSQ